jgi:hypothetical protein
MTRKEFLLTVGFAFASLFGISAFLGVFTKSSSSIEHTNSPAGYGMQNYGL